MAPTLFSLTRLRDVAVVGTRVQESSYAILSARDHVVLAVRRCSCADGDAVTGIGIERCSDSGHRDGDWRGAQPAPLAGQRVDHWCRRIARWPASGESLRTAAARARIHCVGQAELRTGSADPVARFRRALDVRHSWCPLGRRWYSVQRCGRAGASGGVSAVVTRSHRSAARTAGVAVRQCGRRCDPRHQRFGRQARRVRRSVGRRWRQPTRERSHRQRRR
jgi:hypothetical protein